ncbi:MAG: hypothetical protein ONB48_14295 [candidate division KSB1 bacterium]|nr:hypothetical protein [candidate division KSB1 bacterium]MDZ7273593.1 hypothetical protein [candidate division KSB1 bacterium]MDZ7286816.1 hypothetical protein [candidate division KSB1 bacterium]MDZ7299827.1 hypothetical protein [candidate division KSB1 bacterium]MDZ7309264.1 hypothetical protein [candidate division KSB1 bacterium]
MHDWQQGRRLRARHRLPARVAVILTSWSIRANTGRSRKAAAPIAMKVWNAAR